MSATIYLHEFRARFRSIIVWSLAVAAIIFLFSSIFPGFASQAATLKALMSRFPPALLDAFGMQNTDLSTVLGFYSFVFVFVQLCLAIQAANYGFGLVSIEESELTADFLLSKPVSRAQVMTSKLLAALTSLTITNLVVWVVSFISLATFNGGRPYDAGTLVLVLISIILFQLFFLGVGLVISLLVKRVRSVTPYALGLGFGMYFLSAFSAVLAEVKLEYLTPFKHLDPAYIVRNVAFDTPLVVLNVAVSLIALATSYWLYNRRDIHAVS
ncbi:MAG: ABC transporter permease subunit [Anaerolineaceae bacterium]|nr:ABC transporter permease subunit [Anaerolineaceae bacterium]